MHTYDASGAFEAALGEHGQSSLARRPRSSEPWELGWQQVQHRWSTGRWDWALAVHDVALDDVGFAALRQQLGES